MPVDERRALDGRSGVTCKEALRVIRRAQQIAGS